MLAITETAMPGIGVSVPHVVERTAMPCVAYRISGQMSDMPRFAPPYIEKLHGWMREHGVAQAGPVFFRYRRFGNDGSVELDVGAATGKTVAGDSEVEAGEWPAGRYASATYTGPYDRLYDAFSMLNGWMLMRKLQAAQAPGGNGGIACQLEVYRIGPKDVSDPANCETDIMVLLA